MPRSRSQASNAPGTAPAVRRHERMRCQKGSSRALTHRAGEHVAVAVQVLGGGVHDEIGAELDRPRQHRRRHRVVDGHPRAGGMGEPAHGGEVGDLPGGIGRRLDPHKAGRRRGGSRLPPPAGPSCRRTPRRAPRSARTRRATCARPSRAPSRRRHDRRGGATGRRHWPRPSRRRTGCSSRRPRAPPAAARHARRSDCPRACRPCPGDRSRQASARSSSTG